MKYPLVWVDLETTGLVYTKDKILQVACILTDEKLRPLADPFERAVHATESELERMDPSVQLMHKNTGLWDRCMASKNYISNVDFELHQLISSKMEPRQGTIAGSNVLFDKVFMQFYMTETSSFLKHRILDVSSINEAVRRFSPHTLESLPRKKYRHEALSDIRESIKELQWYQENVFK